MPEYMGTTTVEGVTLHLYGYTEEERVKYPPLKEDPAAPSWLLVPDLSPKTDALVNGIIDSVPGWRPPKVLTTEMQRERYIALVDNGVDHDAALRDARKW